MMAYFPNSETCLHLKKKKNVFISKTHRYQRKWSLNFHCVQKRHMEGGEEKEKFYVEKL